MINVIYDRNHMKVTVEGHSGAAEKGKDLICAMASMLTYNLAYALASFGTDKEIVKDVRSSLEEGFGVIECTPVRRREFEALLMMDTICAGFELMAMNYPDNIRYTEA